MTKSTSTAPECPDCGTAWDTRCRRATGQAWDPTVGIRSRDVEARAEAAAAAGLLRPVIR